MPVRRICASLCLLLCAVAFPTNNIELVMAKGVPIVRTSTCHDNVWDPGEYCGYDATVATHVPDMNHDCLVDGLDLQLMYQQFLGVGMTGPNLSGDIKGGPACPGDNVCPDGRVSLPDFSYFASKIGFQASPCTPVPIPSVCGGSIALSFSSNPNTITNTASQGANVVLNAYVVVSGVLNAQMFEFGMALTPNVQIVQVLVPNSSTDSPAEICGNHGYNIDQIVFLGTPVAFGPAVVATIQYVLTDSNPASITMLSSTNCPYAQSRWTDPTVSLSHKWASMSGIGMNGPAPADPNTGCPASGQFVGQVWSEKTNNCVYNSGTDDLLAGLTVQAGAYSAITDASGNYSLWLPTGTSYTIKMAAAVNDPWKKFSPCQSPTTYPVTPVANTLTTGKNFAMLPIGHITGNVYRDFAGTTACAKDGIDAPVVGRMIQASGASNYIGYADNNGDYSIGVASGAYNVTNFPFGGDPFVLPGCQTALYSVNVAANTTAGGRDFALNLANPNSPCDVFLNLISHPFHLSSCGRLLSTPCPGIQHEYIVTLNENVASGIKLGTVAKLDINLDPKFTINTVTSDCTFTSTSPNTHERVVSITTDINPGHTCTVHVLATPSGGAPYTSTVTLDDQGVGCTGTKVRTLTESKSFCSCDPNDMAVQPGCGDDGQVAQDAPLTYTIRFENIGTGPAHDIYVEDVLDEDLDLNTVSLVTSSHPVTEMQVENSNKLVFSFEGIDLPGTPGPPGSNQGEVVFTVRPLPVEDQIDGYVENAASIVFDFNDPVITNTVVTTFVDNPCPATPVGRDPLPASNYLGSNYPNPFNPATTITYGLEKREHVTITIYNIKGSLIRTLVSDDKPAGWYTAKWDGRDQKGNPVASGVYFSQMRAGSFSGSKKLVLLK